VSETGSAHVAPEMDRAAGWSQIADSDSVSVRARFEVSDVAPHNSATQSERGDRADSADGEHPRVWMERLSAIKPAASEKH
jgi:hypothetical protein